MRMEICYQQRVILIRGVVSRKANILDCKVLEGRFLVFDFRVIHSFIQQIISEHLLHVRHFSRHLGYINE